MDFLQTTILNKEDDQNNDIKQETELINEITLEDIKQKIESMNKLQHIEVLKIIKKYKNVKLNENKNGVYINISYLPKKAVQELEVYIKYIEDQMAILNP